MAAWDDTLHVRAYRSLAQRLRSHALTSVSQLIGSTLALEYMRAEYVAPL